MQFWSRVLLRIWIKIAHSTYLKVEKNCNFTSKCSFGPLSNCSDAQFSSRSEVRLWTEIGFSNQIQHVILNSFKNFSGPKFRHPRTFEKNGNKRLFQNDSFSLLLSTPPFDPFSSIHHFFCQICQIKFASNIN